MILCFELSMPQSPVRWSGDGLLYARIRNLGSSQKTKEQAAKLIGSHFYSFGDGWGASVVVREIDAEAARRIR